MVAQQTGQNGNLQDELWVDLVVARRLEQTHPSTDSK